MAVTVEGLLNPGGLRWSFTGDGIRRYRFIYKLKVDTAPDLVATSVAVYAALLSAGVDLGTVCPLDTGAYCDEIAPQEVIPRMLPNGGTSYWEWRMAIGYSSQLGEEMPSNEKNPLNRQVSINFDFEYHPNAAEKAIDENSGADPQALGPVENSAKDPQVREVRDGKLLVRIQKNVASYDWRNFRKARYDKPTSTSATGYEKGFLLSRNKDAWNVYGPFGGVFGTTAVGAGEALCTRLTGQSVIDNGTRFVQLNGEFLIDPRHHRDVFPDQGFFYLKGTNKDGSPKRVQFITEGGWSTTPQLLDGSGNPASAGTVVTLSNQYYPLRDWSGLGLP